MPENNSQDPRSLWRTTTDPSTNEVTITPPTPRTTPLNVPKEFFFNIHLRL